MRKLLHAIILVASCFWSTGVSAAETASYVNVSDLVNFARIGDPLTFGWGEDPTKTEVIKLSPDGKKAVVLVRGAEATRGSHVSTLLIYSTEELFSKAQPRVIARFEALGGWQPISYLQWLDDNRSLVFVGSRGEGTPQLWRLNVATGALVQLSHVPGILQWGGISSDGRRSATIYHEGKAVSAEEDIECRLYGCRVDASGLWGAGRVTRKAAVRVEISDLGTGRTWQIASPNNARPDLLECDQKFEGGISPNGTFGVRLCMVRPHKIPKDWLAYRTHPMLTECAAQLNPYCLRRGYLVNLETGVASAWTDAPLPAENWAVPPIWIDEGKTLLVPQAFETLGRAEGHELWQRTRRYAVHAVDVAKGQTTRVGWLSNKLVQVTKATWTPEARTIEISGKDKSGLELPVVSFAQKGTGWESVDPIRGRGIRFALNQSLNAPPKLVATDLASGLQKVILDPNPWLKQKTLGKVQAIQWQSSDGRVWKGGLYYPPNYTSGKRYPLVIQTHGFSETIFSLQGEALNFPGQALSSQGVMVLQVNENERREDGLNLYTSHLMWENGRYGYEGAIDHLDRLGLIDRSKVGTIGWSATGPTTAALLAFSDYPIAAAAFTDSGVFGLWWSTYQGLDSEFDLYFGAPPFGRGLKPWLELSPSFNLDRVQTPMLMWGAGSVGGVWDWYAGLRRQNKPVELWHFPTGTHDVYQVSHRLRANQLLVDWFTFWLIGGERDRTVSGTGESEESLAAQYSRWRTMRQEQAEVMKLPRPPRLEWNARPRLPGA